MRFRRGLRGETARRVGVEEALRVAPPAPPTLVFRVSREGRRDKEAGE